MTGSHATARNFLTLLAALLIVRGPVAADEAGTESAAGRRPAAHDPLQGRQTCQIVQHRQGERWLLYLGRLDQQPCARHAGHDHPDHVTALQFSV